jgi:glutamine cyclotransferase
MLLQLSNVVTCVLKAPKLTAMLLVGCSSSDAILYFHHCQVLNGIAWDAGGRRLWFTGKRWPVIYEVELQSS